MVSLKEFIKEFGSGKENWKQLPEGFPNCDLNGLSSEEIGKFGAIRTSWELSRPKKGTVRSRVWQSPRGYKFLIPWSNAALLRIFIRKVTITFPRSEYRSKTQTDDAARSVIANIEEGWKRPTTAEYLNFLGFSQASLEEVKGDVERWLQDGFVSSVPESNLKDLGIDLRKWNHWLQSPLNSSKILYFPLGKDKGRYRKLKEIKGEDISYEMLVELVNKTDWNLRRLVESLENKLAKEQKAWQVEQARIKSNLKWRK